MLITRIPPSADELVRRALADTPFLKQAEGVAPHLVTSYAELAASLAAELWEAERHTLIGLTLPTALIADVARALVVHAAQVDFETTLYDWHARTERAIATLGTLQTEVAGEPPTPAAKTELDNVDGDLDRVRVALKRALDVFEREIDAIEWAKSGALQASIGAV